jgi:hypothetical protein
MKKSLTLILFALAVTLICWLAVGRVLKAVNAQSKAAVPKWEHCAITEFYATESSGKAAGFAKISYFDPAGYREQWLMAEGEVIAISNRNDPGIFQHAREAALSNAFAQLSNQGWELVGEGRYARTVSVQVTDNLHTERDDRALYFKRIKP